MFLLKSKKYQIGTTQWLWLWDPSRIVCIHKCHFTGLELCKCCDPSQYKQGCTIRNLVCSCGIGCASDYRYDNMQECQSALRGKW